MALSRGVRKDGYKNIDSTPGRISLHEVLENGVVAPRPNGDDVSAATTRRWLSSIGIAGTVVLCLSMAFLMASTFLAVNPDARLGMKSRWHALSNKVHKAVVHDPLKFSQTRNALLRSFNSAVARSVDTEASSNVSLGSGNHSKGESSDSDSANGHLPKDIPTEVQDVTPLWEVVSATRVLIRARPSLMSKAIGARKSGEYVLGVDLADSENYIALVKEPGYMKTYLKHRKATLLMPVKMSFKRGLKAGCLKVGAETYPIGDHLTCEASAVAFGLPMSRVELNPEKGCHIRGEPLEQGSICCAKPCPPIGGADFWLRK